MKVDGSITVDAPREEVFSEMQDPAMLGRAIPNCESVERIGDDEYEAIIEERIAGVTLRMSVDIALTELREPEYVEISLEADALGGNTGAEGTGSFDLSQADGGGTEIDYVMDISVSGKLASLGFKMLNHVVSDRIGAMADNIEEIFEEADAAQSS